MHIMVSTMPYVISNQLILLATIKVQTAYITDKVLLFFCHHAHILWLATADKHMYMYTHKYMLTHTDTHANTHKNVHTHTRAHTNKNTHTNTHMHGHKVTCSMQHNNNNYHDSIPIDETLYNMHSRLYTQ